jgi:hypothetical protein
MSALRRFGYSPLNFARYHAWCWRARGPMLHQTLTANANAAKFLRRGAAPGRARQTGSRAVAVLGGGRRRPLAHARAAYQQAIAKPVHSRHSPKKLAPETHSKSPPVGIL